ncbi:MAG: hypothetical protein NTW19_06095 [Planctomycetota bacterium]|nr:hypothetical protein [Planctomycetota bacterium]
MSEIESTDGTCTIQARFPRAHDVFVVGEFNNWSTTATRLVAIGDGIWEARLAPLKGLSRIYFFVWEHGQRVGKVFERDADGREFAAMALA